jgi:Flagellar transcriptional activator (FlhC)
MRISDERYRRDLRRLQIAWQMILLGARTPTIMRWTRLSKYNVRKLRNEYGGDSVPRERLRGKAPFRVEFFCKSATLRAETPALVGLLRHFRALPAAGEVTVEGLPELSRAERLCIALEEFRAICPTSEIDFERVVILMKELVRGELIRVAMCSMHPELVIHDCLVAREPSCAHCWREMHAGLAYFKSRTPKTDIPCESETDMAGGFQQSLF